MKITNISYTMFLTWFQILSYTQIHIHIIESISYPGTNGATVLKFFCESDYLGSLLKKEITCAVSSLEIPIQHIGGEVSPLYL